MNKEPINNLIKSAIKAYHNAYAPYSKFSVGAAVLDENGSIYNGCNVENAAYPSGSCAEEQAIGNMIANGGKLIREIVIIGISDKLITPCGACRQRIREFSDKDTIIHIHHIEQGLQQSFKLDELLPYSFGPENL
ncbi:MAG: cytidine deaminase [Sulfurovum sp.]|nr:cytidine deaminase [Sulfurovum sp.]